MLKVPRTGGSGAVRREQYCRGWLLFGAGGWCFDVSPSVTWWLRAARPRFVSRNWTLLVHPDDRERLQQLAGSLQRDGHPQPTTIRWIGLHGKVITTEWRILFRKYATGSQYVIARVTRMRGQEVAA